MATRAELPLVTGERYRSSARAERGRILNEFVALTGSHRKHAIRLLARRPVPAKPRRDRRPAYGPDVEAALLALWNLSDRLCSKRLKEMIPLLLPAAIRHGVAEDREELRQLLLRVSPATIDRLLCEARIAAQSGRRRRAGMGSAIRREGSHPHLQRLERSRAGVRRGRLRRGRLRQGRLRGARQHQRGGLVHPDARLDGHRDRLDGMRAPCHAQRRLGYRGHPERNDDVPLPTEGHRLRQRQHLHEGRSRSLVPRCWFGGAGLAVLVWRCWFGGAGLVVLAWW